MKIDYLGYTIGGLLLSLVSRLRPPRAPHWIKDFLDLRVEQSPWKEGDL